VLAFKTRHPSNAHLASAVSSVTPAAPSTVESALTQLSGLSGDRAVASHVLDFDYEFNDDDVVVPGAEQRELKFAFILYLSGLYELANWLSSGWQICSPLLWRE
jgi:hypothetical protein